MTRSVSGPQFNENELITVDADQIIIAIGQMTDEQFVGHIGVESERGFFKADPITGQTSVEGVFAGGDNASGPAAVIDAVAAGKRVAESIERFLTGKEMLTNRFEENLKPLSEDLLPETEDVEKKARVHPEELAPAKRLLNFRRGRKRTHRGTGPRGSRKMPELRPVFGMQPVRRGMRAARNRPRYERADSQIRSRLGSAYPRL